MAPFLVQQEITDLSARLKKAEDLISAIIARLQAEPSLLIDYNDIRTNPFSLNDKPKPQL